MDYSQDSFNEWINSPYYNKLYAMRNNEEAGLFLIELMKKYNARPENKIFDCSCGTGVLAKQLSDAGYNVTGIDLSFMNIEYATRAGHESLEFYQHDLRFPFRILYFDYAFTLFSNFGYFGTDRDNNNVLRSVSVSLKTNGVYFLDYINLRYAENNLKHQQELIIDDTLFEITKWFDEDFFYKKILVTDQTAEAPVFFNERHAKYSMGDINDMLAFQGFQIQELYGDYDLSAYDVMNSPRMIIIARKVNKN